MQDGSGSDDDDIGTHQRRGRASRLAVEEENDEGAEGSSEPRSEASPTAPRSPAVSCEGPCQAAAADTGAVHDEALRLGQEMADAAQGGRTDDVLALLARRATVDVLDTGYNRWTALMWAGWWGNNAMARALLEAGANPALRDSKGCSAYDVAVHEAESILIPNPFPE